MNQPMLSNPGLSNPKWYVTCGWSPTDNGETGFIEYGLSDGSYTRRTSGTNDFCPSYAVAESLVNSYLKYYDVKFTEIFPDGSIEEQVYTKGTRIGPEE